MFQIKSQAVGSGHEMESKLLYAFNNKEKELITEGCQLFSTEVLNTFPNAVDDLDEAVKCLGFSQYTACVFHLMRTMEGAVRSIGAKLNATVMNKHGDYVPWGIIINNLKHRIDKFDNDERIKWTEILVLLESVKLCWRNETMHPKDIYTEEQAQAIFEAVKSFLNCLAKELGN